MTKPTSLSSSSITYEWTYDVFLNFRGKDTRTGFTGNLYNALQEKGINTFMDDKKLRKGEEITPALMKAIQESRIAIVIFSENYATSTFCLEELVKILECIKHNARLVWPVFYQVDPSDVRHQKGNYAEAFAKHEEQIIDKEKVKRWRFALQEAGNTSGWHFKHGYEYEFIGNIAQQISKKINRIPVHVANYPVGLESRVQEVNSLVDVKSNEGVHMVGIYGMGGIGKTTLACAIYNLVADQFESLCFLADIRENSMKHGLPQLQEILLSNLVGEKDIKLLNVKIGIPIIKSRLCQKKILLILDDIDKSEQLDALAGGLDWFGFGSRIIITTRNKNLLHACGIERTYEVEGLNHEEALELFSWNAFKRQEVNPSYLDITNRVMLYSNGLPLSLEIIGSDLFGKTVLEWKSALDTYERISHENIQKILRVSYDGLQEFEKEIFLDIACFFKGYYLDDVINILLNGRGLAPDYAIKVLIDKCLIKINEYRVKMHDLIEDMGREIVRQESPSKPGERSRLWFCNDILHVFKENKGSDITEIIMLRPLTCKEVRWDGNALRKMENLKILVIENARFSRGPNHLPKSLKALKWHGYPAPSLPADFDPKELAMLDLSLSFLTLKNQLTVNFKSLTKMNLSGVLILKHVPDMSGVPNLIELRLDNCQNLVEVHDSVGFLDKLEHLNLRNCTSLSVLPHGINLTSLLFLILSNCTSLKRFPEILGKMKNISYVSLNGSSIRDLPFSIINLVGLRWLILKNCKGLYELPSSIFMLPKLYALEVNYCTKLPQIQKGKGQEQEAMFSNLKYAGFGYCNLTEEFLTALLPCLHCVTKLHLSRSNITILPSLINTCIFLKNLMLDECKELREIKGLPPNIEYLSAINCKLLNFQSRKMLRRKELHKTGGTYFCFPGSAIPSWFSHNRRGPSLPFWFINKFPTITVCVVGVFSSFVHCMLDVIINGIPQFRVTTPLGAGTYSAPSTDHIIMLDLKHGLESGEFEILNIENGWNHAEISFVEYRATTAVKSMAVHVQEQKSSRTPIRFTDPGLPAVEKQNQVYLGGNVNRKRKFYKGGSPCKKMRDWNWLTGR